MRYGLSSCFPKTFEHINADVKASNHSNLKRKQLLTGINAGHAKLMKMSHLLMSSPLVFLLMTGPIQGLLLLMAILTIVTEKGLNIKGEDCGDYKQEVEERLTLEQHWYTLLYEA
jgi:hypothetical protein